MWNVKKMLYTLDITVTVYFSFFMLFGNMPGNGVSFAF